jgi:hypothetical protein
MDPALAIVACCALAPVGLGVAWLLGLMGKPDKNAPKLGKETGGREGSWLSTWLGRSNK